MLVVTAGTLSTYGLDGTLCQPTRVPSGHAYVLPARAHHAHLFHNRGTVPVTFIAYYINVSKGKPPAGPAVRPSECPAAPR
jgi:hypothetical protein